MLREVWGHLQWQRRKRQPWRRRMNQLNLLLFGGFFLLLSSCCSSTSLVETFHDSSAVYPSSRLQLTVQLVLLHGSKIAFSFQTNWVDLIISRSAIFYAMLNALNYSNFHKNGTDLIEFLLVILPSIRHHCCIYLLCFYSDLSYMSQTSFKLNSIKNKSRVTQKWTDSTNSFLTN